MPFRFCKGTVSRAVAQSLGWALLDSGALYRLVALAGRRAGIGLEDGDALGRLAERFNIRFGSTETGDEAVWLDGGGRKPGHSDRGSRK